MLKLWGFLVVLAMGFSLAGTQVLNEDFASAKPGMKIPPGWNNYGKQDQKNFTEIIRHQGKNALRIVDRSRNETGICRDFPVQPGKYYRGTVQLTSLGPAGAEKVIRLQIRFLCKDGKATWAGGILKLDGVTSFGGVAPANASGIRVYIYTSFNAEMDVALQSFKLEMLQEAPPVEGNPKLGYVPPVVKLKDMCLSTPLDQVTILADRRYRKDAARLADAIYKSTGRRPAIMPPAAKVSGHKILLGNRDTNEVIEHLYRRFFAFTDMVYPGKGGYELRTVHNPFGDKVNYVIVGGSDDAGVSAAADRLIVRAGKTLEPVIDVRIHPALPADIPSTEYETRMGSGFPGYGWNTLSWYLENYYRSGDPKYAREFIRLGLHTKPSDMPTLKKVNAESFWDFSQPLSTPYHYMGHYIVLLWDLVEEQDVFSDEERLAVTRALAKQITHPDINMCYDPQIDTAPPGGVIGDRHAQWSVMMMYVLARYMQRDYPDIVWKKVLQCAEHFHEPIFRAGTWGAASSTFGWFASSMLNEPAQYLLLAGKGKPHPEGMLMNAVKVYEIMWEPGIGSDANNTMSANNHRLLAALTGDGKFHYYADQLDRQGPSMKLGQSFRSIHDKARIPTENIGKWLIAPLPEAACIRRNFKRPFTGLTLNTGYRDSLDLSGDRVMFDLLNELGRKPYQLNSLYHLRINGKVFLNGYENYLQVLKNGVASAHVPVAGRLRKAGAAGNMVFHVSAVPDMAHGEWERTLILKKRKAALIADRITAREDGALQIVQNWELPMTGAVTVKDNSISFLNSMSISAAEMKLRADGPIALANAARTAKLKKAGDKFHAVFSLAVPLRGDMTIRLVCTSVSAASVDLALDGKMVSSGISMDTAGADTVKQVRLSNLDLAAGEHTLTFTVRQPGESGSDIQLWRVNLAARGVRSCIAGAGLEAGGLFHKGSTPVLKKGESHTFFTICGTNTSAERVAAHPNAAVLRIPEKTVVFSGEFKPFGKGRLVWVDEKETAVMDEAFHVTVRPTDPAAVQALQALQGVPFQPAAKEKNTAATAPRKSVETGVRTACAEAIAYRGKPALFMGGQGQAAVVAPDGNILLKLQVPGRIMSLHGTGKLLLIGTVEDKLYAFNEDGKLQWTHQSLCATPFEKQKHYYWYKGAYPGVYALSSLDGEIYTGGACTVERLSADGKVIKRYEQFWGPQSALLPLVRPDGEKRMLSARLFNGNSADIYAVDPVRDTSSVMFRGTAKGFLDFPGFNSMSRSQMVLCDVNGDGRQELIGASYGMYTWIQIFDDHGKVLHQVNLGGKPLLNSLAAAQDLVVTVDPLRRMMIFDGSLNVRYLRDLAEEPRQVLVRNGKIYVLDRAGINVFDRTGKRLNRMNIPGARHMVFLADGTLSVLDFRDNVYFY